MLKDLVDRVFKRSPEAVLTNMLEASDLDAEELKRLRKLINRKIQEEKP
jgi:predicted transcriptional regulator